MNLPRTTPLLIAASLFASDLQAERAKLLQLGWCQPDSAFLRDHWETIDKHAPFDGIAITAEFYWNGNRYEDHGVIQAKKWPREALEPALENIKKARFERVTHNFVRVNGPQKRIDWFHDEQWEAVVANVSNMAWFAKEAGLKGICFDPEQYASSQYTWRPESGKSFEETAIKARQRGAEMMKAIGKEYPEITIWALWLFSKTLPNCDPEEANQVLSGMDYNLWPAFLNGWLDALPEKARLVDGMEDAYYYQDISEVTNTYAVLKNPNSVALSATLAPEHRDKYQRQVSVSFGLYLDAYVMNPSHVFALGPLRGITRLDRMRQTITHALETADDYVWLYNEQVRWWPIETPSWKENGRFMISAKKQPGGGKVAEEAFPGITETVNLARNPDGFASAWIERNRTQLTNRVQNANLVLDGSNKTPTHWWTYGNHTDGRINIIPTKEGNQLQFMGLTNGLMAQNIAVTEGRLYHFEAKVLKQGSGELSVRTRWQSANGKWNNILRDRSFLIPKGDGEWQTVSGTVSAPYGSPQLVFYFACNGQQSPEDQVLIKDIAVYEIP